MLTEQPQKLRAAGSHKVDPVVTEIIRNGLVAITEQMKTNLMRTACNMIIYEAQDFTVGLFDTRGQIVSIGIGLPMFIRGMSDTVKAMLAHFGPGGIHPEDVLVTNDAFITGSHLNHMTFAVPIFHGEDIVGFSACMAHWQDIGGALDGMTKDIFSEGLQMPIVKLYRRGEPSEDLFAVIRMNVRLPERAMGDLNAQIAATRLGSRRFLELIERYGRDAVLGGIAAIMDHTEAIAREQVLSIPDGVYEAESFMDDDGIDNGRRIPIKVKVTVSGDEMAVDLTEVGEQVKGFYNSGEATGRACCQVAFKCLTSPIEKPINEGSFRPLKIILPPGRVVSAVRPSPMRWWMTFPMTIVDTIFKALASAIPDRVIAAHHADLMSCMINGRMPDDGKIYLVSGGLIGGGWGAKKGQDGSSATICINDGDTHNSPVEQIEAKYPMLVERYALREDSGGAGTWQGGLGVEKVVRAVNEFMFNVQIERVHCRPWGLFGGHPGAGNQVSVRCGNEPELSFPSGKVLARLLKAGEAYILRSGGGGGYGSPLDRPIEQIESDLREGYISKQRAERCYGIVFRPGGDVVDVAATPARRAALRPSYDHLDWSDTVEPQPGGNAAEEFFRAGNAAIFKRCC
ncbi:MAG: hydantoinase B/oxoprolinase family protein [Betaproteobacteria bacterium]|nr:hydantoinase B/oxoprolinase family protein [Betaproteobacteria bacterium]